MQQRHTISLWCPTFPHAIGIVLLALLGVVFALNAGFTWVLRRRPVRILAALRRFFGRVINPIVLWFADRFHLEQSVVYHRGRKSGREYATPLCVSGTSDGFIVPAAFGTDADWFRNLRASSEARLTTGGATYRVKPEVIDADEALRSAGGTPGCPCWRSLRVEEFVRLKPITNETAHTGA